ncbi:MAG: endolytic transglycosylase MltG [Gemmatimonadetes bacterium]|nr:endolytic transglycosylase MltG [Gemmatimonadota bacterium]
MSRTKTRIRRLFPVPCSLFPLLLLAGCGSGQGKGDPVRFTVPRGAGMSTVADTLARRDVIGSTGTFKLYARIKGASARLQPGVYEVRPGASYDLILRKLTTGDVVKTRLVIPEGWELRRIAPRLAEATGMPADSILSRLMDPALAEKYGVPGPTLEGYLYPATYVFPLGSSLDAILRELTGQYKRAWTPQMRERAQALGMDEREVVTLASIVEKEAKVWSERPTIAGVYHNRLERGMRLEADPTVQYALGEHQRRLLRRHIQETAADPYNTYRHKGLPPGPIASPSRGAIEATLNPAEHDFLFFVARANGTHVFTRTFNEHLRQVARYRAEMRAQRQPQQPATR